MTENWSYAKVFSKKKNELIYFELWFLQVRSIFLFYYSICRISEAVWHSYNLYNFNFLYCSLFDPPSTMEFLYLYGIVYIPRSSLFSVSLLDQANVSFSLWFLHAIVSAKGPFFCYSSESSLFVDPRVLERPHPAAAPLLPVSDITSDRRDRPPRIKLSTFASYSFVSRPIRFLIRQAEAATATWTKQHFWPHSDLCFHASRLSHAHMCDWKPFERSWPICRLLNIFSLLNIFDRIFCPKDFAEITSLRFRSDWVRSKSHVRVFTYFIPTNEVNLLPFCLFASICSHNGRDKTMRFENETSKQNSLWFRVQAIYSTLWDTARHSLGEFIQNKKSSSTERSALNRNKRFTHMWLA